MSKDIFIYRPSNKAELTVREAGRLGGLAVSRKRGRRFYQRIGRKGQRVMREKHPGMAKKWGKLGGRPRKLSLIQMGRPGEKLIKEECGPALNINTGHPRHS